MFREIAMNFYLPYCLKATNCQYILQTIGQSDIHEFAAKVRKGIETIDSELDFNNKHKIINLLEVKIKLAVEKRPASCLCLLYLES